MKKKILFTYYEMFVGGSTTSLLSILQNFDYDKYDVDLQLYRNRGPLLSYIPKEVNLLPQACVEYPKWLKSIIAILNLSLPIAVFKSYKYRKKLSPNSQLMAYSLATLCKKPKKEYDTAIGFLEGWSDIFANKYVKAKKKISWVHIDFEKAHYFPEIDKKMFSVADKIICVSDECLKNFKKSFPSLAGKCKYIPNILTKEYLKQRESEFQDNPIQNYNGLKLLSVCRLAIDHKGLDRGVYAISKLIKEGRNVKWYIIGDGKDRQQLESLIKENGLENDIILLGERVNPYPYFKFFDAFLLPSRFEGKPMSVTEAQMLEIMPIVTHYASAEEQIIDGKTGIITKNTDDAIYDGIKRVIESSELIREIKENLKKTDFSNQEEIEKLYQII